MMIVISPVILPIPVLKKYGVCLIKFGRPCGPWGPNTHAHRPRVRLCDLDRVAIQAFARVSRCLSLLPVLRLSELRSMALLPSCLPSPTQDYPVLSCTAAMPRHLCTPES